jgi:hypothetical protein
VLHVVRRRAQACKTDALRNSFALESVIASLFLLRHHPSAGGVLHTRITARRSTIATATPSASKDGLVLAGSIRFGKGPSEPFKAVNLQPRTLRATNILETAAAFGLSGSPLKKVHVHVCSTRIGHVHRSDNTMKIMGKCSMKGLTTWCGI